MAFFDFLDSRRGIARWADKCFKSFKAQFPEATEQEMALVSLGIRYKSFASDALKVYISTHAPNVRNIHHLCYLVAEAELHNLIDSMSVFNLMRSKDDNPLQQTRRVIDDELAKLGYQKNA